MQTLIAALIGSVITAAVALTASLLAHHQARIAAEANERRDRRNYSRRWDQERVHAYLDYLVSVSQGRRRLLNAAFERLGQRKLEGAAQTAEERVAILNNTVAGFNRIRLLSSSPDVVDAARQMLINIEEWVKLLDKQAAPAPDEVQKLRQQYERDTGGIRRNFISAVQWELELDLATVSSTVHSGMGARHGDQRARSD